MEKKTVILTGKRGFYAKGQRVLVKNADEAVSRKVAVHPEVKKVVAKKATKTVKE